MMSFSIASCDLCLLSLIFSGALADKDDQAVSRCLDVLWQIRESKKVEFIKYLQNELGNLLKEAAVPKIRTLSLFRTLKKYRSFPLITELLFHSGFKELVGEKESILRWGRHADSITRLQFVYDALVQKLKESTKMGGKWVFDIKLFECTVYTKPVKLTQNWMMKKLIIHGNGIMRLYADEKALILESSFDLNLMDTEHLQVIQALWCINVKDRNGDFQIAFQSERECNKLMEYVSRFNVESESKEKEEDIKNDEQREFDDGTYSQLPFHVTRGLIMWSYGGLFAWRQSDF